MSDNPKTLEEARKERYDLCPMNPKGTKYVEGNCTQHVPDWTGWHINQCSRKYGYGPGGLYCKQHAKKFDKEEIK